MKIGGTTTLDNISGGTLRNGIVPWGRVFSPVNGVQGAANAGLVTTTAAGIQVVTVTIPAPGAPIKSHLFQAFGQVRHTKGGVIGATSFEVRVFSGPAVQWHAIPTSRFIESDPNQALGTVEDFSFASFGLAEIGAVDLVLELFAISAGSNGTVAIGDGQLGLLTYNYFQ